MTIDLRALGVCVFACAVAMATVGPAETNWDALDSAGWGGTGTGTKQSEDGEKVAQTAASGSDASAEIKQAFVKLGMAEKRAACFGAVLAKQLSPEEQQEAAKLVGESSDADEVKLNVMTAGPTMVGGFSAADASCPEGTGS